MAGHNATIEDSSWNHDEDEMYEDSAKYDNDNISETVNIKLSVQNYQDNVRSVHDKVSYFVCDTCPNSFRRNSHLKRHQERVHSTARKYTCLACSKGCVSKDELVTHMKYHTGERSFICDICSDTFITNSRLKTHKRKHDGTMLQCQTCDKKFLTLTRLNVHVKFVHLKASTRMRSERRRELRRMGGVQSKLFLKAKSASQKLDNKKEQCFETCTICEKTFKKMSKKKIHMVTHTQIYKNLSIVNNVIWSEGRTKVSCIDCGREFQGTFKVGHMKAHIAQVHYQLQNIDNLDSFDISEIAKRKDTLAFDKKKTGPKDHEITESLRENVPNVHARKSENQAAVIQSEEFINFLSELNAEFPGPQLVMVLGFVQDLKETGKTDKIGQIIEEGRNGNYRNVFEDLGVLQTNHRTKTKKATSKMEVDRKETFKKEEVNKEMVVKEMVKKEKVKKIMGGNKVVKKENVKKESSSALMKDKNQYNTEDYSTETTFEQKPKRRKVSKIRLKLGLSRSVNAMQREKKKEQTKNVCPICGNIFSKLSKQKIHLMTHTQMFKTLCIDKNVIWSDDKTKVSCMDCGREFKGRDKNGHMKTHIALVHYQMHNIDNLDTLNMSDITKSVKTLNINQKKVDHQFKKEDTFFCEFCFEEFSRSVSLEKHKLVKHEGLGNDCDSCAFSSSTLKELLEHQSSKHSAKAENIEKDLKFKQAIECDICLQKFAYNQGLKRHKAFRHEGLGYSCDQCDHLARSPLGLLKHKRLTHGFTSESIPDDVLLSSFQCKDCGKLYHSKSVLRRHALVHTGERPFPCNKCEKRFRQQSALEGHKGIHNKNQSDI